MGDSRPTNYVSTFSSCVDDLHTGGIIQAVYTRDNPATRSASIHSIGPGSQVYGVFLEELPEGDGNAVDDEHRFSSIDRWSV